MILYYPFWERFDFDTDEGINLIKSLLVNYHFPLYSQIWNDQPPLFTHLLAITLRVFGSQVVAGRLLVLGFSALLLWSAYVFLKDTVGYYAGSAAGHAAAIVGTLLVVSLPFYNTLSVSVMVGLPSLALAMLSLLALSAWHRSRSSGNKNAVWLVLSAVTLALSVFTKAMIGYLAAIFIVGLLIDEYVAERGAQVRWKIVTPAVYWAVVFAGSCLLMGLFLVGPRNLGQLVSPHLATESAVFLDEIPDKFTVAYQLKDARPYLWLGLLGAAIALLKKHWLAGYLLAWMVGGYILLSLHTPVWYHHQLMVSVPAALLAGWGAGEGVLALVRGIKDRTEKVALLILGIAAVALTATILFQRAPLVGAEFAHKPFYARSYVDPWFPETPFLKKIANHASVTHWVVTDLPMFAFRTRLLVPPELAVFTEKRILAGELTEAEIITALRNYQPEQILLGRFELSQVEAYLDQSYDLLYSDKNKRLYLRADLKGR
jgi:hypothetical protein